MSGLSKLRWCLCASAAVVIGLVGAAGPASAFTVGPAQNTQLNAFEAGSLSAPLTYNGVNVVGGSIETIHDGSFSVSAYTGMIQLQVSNNSNNGGLAGKWLDAWCIDLFDDLQGSTYSQIISQPFSSNGSGHGPPTISNAALGIIGALVDWGDTHYADSSAVQLAIWQTEYGVGNISFSGPVTTWAIASVILAATTADPNYDPNRLREVIDPNTSSPNGNQGLIFEIAGSQVPGGAPLPPTWTMMLVGMAGIGFLAIPRAKKRRGVIAA